MCDKNVVFLLIFLLTFNIWKCKNHPWLSGHTKTGSGLDWPHGMEFADLWAIESKKGGGCCGVVFKLRLAGGSLIKSYKNSRWSVTALAEKKSSWRLLSAPTSSFCASSHTWSNFWITSGCGNQTDLEILRLDFSRSSATLSNLHVMGAYYVY